MTGGRAIQEFVDFLAREHHLTLSIKDFQGYAVKDPDMASLVGSVLIHRSPYCLAVKARCWDRCQTANRALYRKCRSGKPFFGMCYAGWWEWVVPIRYEGRVVAAICAGGFELDAAASAARRHALSETELDKPYRASVAPPADRLARVLPALNLLADVLALRFAVMLNSGMVSLAPQSLADSSRMNVLAGVVEYVGVHYAQDIQLKDLARFCGCSASYLSHMFKRNMDTGIRTYINRVRVERARTLLRTRPMTVAQAADACGFSDPNYFSSVFKRIVGVSPTVYARNREEETVCAPNV